MILYLNDEGIGEEITDESTEETTEEIATSGDAVLHISQQELNYAVEVLPKLYSLFCFWFLAWVCLQMLSRIRRQLMKHTSEMEDKR